MTPDVAAMSDREFLFYLHGELVRLGALVEELVRQLDECEART